MTSQVEDADRARLDGLAAQMFPEQWRRANSKPTGRSKARRSLRERVAHTLRMAELKAAGASCASCRDFRPRPGTGHPKGQMICDAGSDFYGDQIATADGLCTGYVPRATP